MKGYYINLDYRTDRKKLFLAQDVPIEWHRVPGMKTDPGWIGCRESHLRILPWLTGISIIAEDDCQFLQPWHKLEKAMKQLPPDWDMLYLSATLTKELKRYSENLYILKGGYSNTATIYNCNKMNPVTEYILEHKDEIIRMDMFLVNYIQPRFKCFITNPLFACQRRGYSDILHKDIDTGWRQRRRFKEYATQ